MGTAHAVMDRNAVPIKAARLLSRSSFPADQQPKRLKNLSAEHGALRVTALHSGSSRALAAKLAAHRDEPRTFAHSHTRTFAHTDRCAVGDA